MDKETVLQYERHFQSLTFQHLTLSLDHYERGEHRSSAIMVSVFAEAILKDIGIFYGVDFSKQEPSFKTMIAETSSKIRGMAAVSSEDKNQIINLVSRCEEIRQKRNRLVHNKGVEQGKIDTKQAAIDMHHNLLEIVDMYLKTSMATELFKRSEVKGQGKDSTPLEQKFSIFISTINPHSVEQKVFINAVCNQLTDMGITPVRCEFDDYDKGDPMGKVKSTIESCDAFLVIGLERSHTYLYRDKESSSSEEEGIHRRHTSGWLHFESGVAMALNKKIYVLCQKDIYGDGIFDRDWNSYIVVEFPTPLDVKNNKVQMALKKIREFAESRQKS